MINFDELIERIFDRMKERIQMRLEEMSRYFYTYSSKSIRRLSILSRVQEDDAHVEEFDK